MQTAIYRTHSLLTNDTCDLRVLSRSERETLEFRVKVEGGSSEYIADLAKPIETIGASVVSKMTPHETFLCALVVALLFAGSWSWKTWLKHKAKLRKDEVHRDEIKLFLDSQTAHMQHDERQTALWMGAIKKQPLLEDVETV